MLSTVGCNTSTRNSEQNKTQNKQVKIVEKENTKKNLVDFKGERGNTQGNLFYSGIAATKGDWIYYFFKDKLYKIKTDGTQKTLLLNKDGYYLNIVNDWIYYVQESSDIYRVKTDGTENTLILHDDLNIGKMDVIGNYIRYLHKNQEHRTQFLLQRNNLDGTGKVVFEFPYDVREFVTDNEWMYIRDYKRDDKGDYSLSDTKQVIYKTKEDGSSRTRISGLKDYLKILIEGDYMYYLYYEEDEQSIYKYLYREKTDGTNKQKLCDDELVYDKFVNISNGWIYYQNASDDDKIYKIKLDGTQRTKVCDEDCGLYLLVVGDWIIYDDSDFKGLYMIRTDGTQRQEITE
jgi:hypothetical protein